MHTKICPRIIIFLLACVVLIKTSPALAHAFPEESQPAVGAILNEAPKKVQIRFDSRLEDAFSVIIVKDADGNRVSGHTRLDPDSRKSLEVKLQTIAAGDYHVYWSVVSWDGHRTRGDYVFSVKSD